MTNKIKGDGYYWPNMHHQAVELVRKCIDCQRFNVTQQGFHPLQSIHAELPLDHCAIDLAGPFTTSNHGNHYLFVFVDVCTRFVLLRAMPDKQSITIAGILFNIVMYWTLLEDS